MWTIDLIDRTSGLVVEGEWQDFFSREEAEDYAVLHGLELAASRLTWRARRLW